jgi:hypothetical protein
MFTNMKDFLKYTLATITGIILVTILFFILMIGSLSVMVASGSKPVSVSDNSILVLKAGMQIPDRGDQNPLSGLDPLSMTFSPATGLNDILKNIEKAASDPKIKGILIEIGILVPAGAPPKRSEMPFLNSANRVNSSLPGPIMLCFRKDITCQRQLKRSTLIPAP